MRTAIEEIQTFKTSDGKIFESRDEAQEHLENTNVSSAFARMLCSLCQIAEVDMSEALYDHVQVINRVADKVSSMDVMRVALAGNTKLKEAIKVSIDTSGMIQSHLDLTDDAKIELTDEILEGILDHIRP